jgi:hypothetical protein
VAQKARALDAVRCDEAVAGGDRSMARVFLGA